MSKIVAVGPEVRFGSILLNLNKGERQTAAISCSMYENWKVQYTDVKESIDYLSKVCESVREMSRRLSVLEDQEVLINNHLVIYGFLEGSAMRFVICEKGIVGLTVKEALITNTSNVVEDTVLDCIIALSK